MIARCVAVWAGTSVRAGWAPQLNRRIVLGHPARGDAQTENRRSSRRSVGPEVPEECDLIKAIGVTAAPPPSAAKGPASHCGQIALQPIQRRLQIIGRGDRLEHQHPHDRGDRQAAMHGVGRDLIVLGELAAAVGVGADTIRFYEKAGLLLAPARTPAGYRVYEASAVDRLRFIQGAQRLGLKLRDIKDLLAIRVAAYVPVSRPRSCCAAGWLISTRKWLG